MRGALTIKRIDGTKIYPLDPASVLWIKLWDAAQSIRDSSRTYYVVAIDRKSGCFMLSNEPAGPHIAPPSEWVDAIVVVEREAPVESPTTSSGMSYHGDPKLPKETKAACGCFYCSQSANG